MFKERENRNTAVYCGKVVITFQDPNANRQTDVPSSLLPNVKNPCFHPYYLDFPVLHILLLFILSSEPPSPDTLDCFWTRPNDVPLSIQVVECSPRPVPAYLAWSPGRTDKQTDYQGSFAFYEVTGKACLCFFTVLLGA